MITTLKDLLHLKDDYINMYFLHFWYFHTPDIDIFINLKTKEKIILNKNKTLAQQLNITKLPFEFKDKNGIRIYNEYSNDFWEKYQYDENGNATSYENSDGFWEKHKYDENGKEVYFETSDGFWEKHKYDEKDKEVYFKTSNNYWTKRQYDEHGYQIYYENSVGTISDKRPKL